MIDKNKNVMLQIKMPKGDYEKLFVLKRHVNTMGLKCLKVTF